MITTIIKTLLGILHIALISTIIGVVVGGSVILFNDTREIINAIKECGVG